MITREQSPEPPSGEPRPEPSKEEQSAAPHVETASTTGLPERPQRLEIDISPAAIAKILATLALLWLLAAAWQVLLWIVIALMFVATFNPMVRKMQSRVQRPWAITAVVAAACLTVATLLALSVPVLLFQANRFIAGLPGYIAQAQALAQQHGVPIHLPTSTESWTAKLSGHLLGLSMVLVNGVTGALTLFILTVYLLVEGPQVGTSMLSLLPRAERLPVRRMFGEIGAQVGAYMRGQLITSLLAGVFSFLLLSLLRVPEPLALAALMMIADVIPIVGPVVGTAPAVLMALSRGPSTAGIVLVAYLAYQQLEGNFIVPRVYGNVLKLSPFVVLVAFLLGGTLMGLVGVLLALPVTAAIPIVARYYGEWRERVDAAKAGAAPLP